MKVEQIYTSCLSQGAYFIESNGEAAVIDPLREISNYLKLAEDSNSKIKYVFETHFHADFISGHLTIANKTGAKIVYGPQADPNFESIIAEDNQVFKIGAVTITAVHTPGHTLESTSYILKDENGKELIGNNVSGNLCIKFPWPGMLRTTYGDHERCKQNYFATYQFRFTNKIVN